MIQKNIYLAAKKHKFSYVHKLQKYLMNSNDAKLICLKHILDQSIKKCIKFTNFLKRDTKTDLINILLKRYLLVHKNLLIINQQIKNHLIDLCIKPVNKAKCKESVVKYLNKHNSNYAQYLTSIYKNYKYTFIKILIDRLNTFKYINTLVISSIYVKNMYSLLTIYSINFQTILLCRLSEINHLVLHSLLLDSLWFFFRTHLKKDSIKGSINNINIIYYTIIDKQYELSKFSKKFKNFLVEKIYKKFKVIYILNYNWKFINALIRKCLIYCYDVRIFASCSVLIYYNTSVNTFLYTYYNRRINNVLNPFVRIIELNYFLNILMYYYNILNLYIF